MPLEPPVISAAREAMARNVCEPTVKDRAGRLAARGRLLPFAATVSGRRPLAALLLVCSLVAGGCGGGGDDSANRAPPEARPDQFPRAEGRTLAQLRQDLPKGGPVLAPTGSFFVTGQSRLGFGLFTTSRAQIADASAAVYVAPLGGGQASGPYV